MTLAAERLAWATALLVLFITLLAVAGKRNVEIVEVPTSQPTVDAVATTFPRLARPGP